MRTEYAHFHVLSLLTGVGKFRLFGWMQRPHCRTTSYSYSSAMTTISSACFIRVHEVWACSQGTQVRERESGFRYTPTTCFETFPFPEPTDDQRAAIADAARELDRLRNNWLNPPEWTRTETLTFPGSVDGPWARYVHDPDSRRHRHRPLSPNRGQGRRRAKELKKTGTLTNLYNQRPAWLDLRTRNSTPPYSPPTAGTPA